MFRTVLVANRGEIAVRVIRTLRRLGIASVVVYSDADAGARHVREADRAVRIGPASPAQSYLDVRAVVAAAVATGAEALHPGYGFLSENPALALACAESDIVFVGPSAAAIEVMGDKIRAKEAVGAAGVPVVPGRTGRGLSDGDLVEAALELGLPVLLKPSAGGGGKGMRRVADPDALAAEIAAARREALGAFGDGTLLVERWVGRARHIEIQIVADLHGHCIHLGERECSLQRRHQKVVEEAPSVLLDEATRSAMGASAVAAACAVAYEGAGTVEFLVSADRPDEYFFLEMNTRLQVEHPVTEAVTGLDLVEWQLRIAAGEPLGLGQADVRIVGHAVEARVYAEDTERGFLPASGLLLSWREPRDRPGIRVDGGVQTGDEVGILYDPLLAKVIARGRDRAEALARLHSALGEMTVLGVTTNVGFLRRLLAHSDVVAGSLDTELIQRVDQELVAGSPPDEVFAAAALHRLLALEPHGPAVDLWDRPTGWRVGGPAEVVVELLCADRREEVGVMGPPEAARVRVGSAPPVAATARLDGTTMELTVGGLTRRWDVVAHGEVTWLGAGDTWAVRPAPPRSRRPDDGVSAGGPLRSPMPGTVQAVHVQVGEPVIAGAPVVTMEAMKMEFAVTAPAAGMVTALRVRPGQAVALEEVLAEISVERPIDIPEQAPDRGAH
ncbi:MAG: acetyl/propionyl/methylcrotonyl-CoA carboxylase subunit alpha [Acidimicrobiales bacterium]